MKMKNKETHSKSNKNAYFHDYTQNKKNIIRNISVHLWDRILPNVPKHHILAF